MDYIIFYKYDKLQVNINIFVTFDKKDQLMLKFSCICIVPKNIILKIS